MSETGHFSNVSTALFHPKHEQIVSWTSCRENDRFWVLASHPNLNLFTADHDSGLIMFRLERERPAFVVHQDLLHYICGKYVRSYDFNTSADLGLLSVHKFGKRVCPSPDVELQPGGKGCPRDDLL
ncbi:hypothetical protein B0H14DRAFT_3491881 [Mycena olivaceomarginata]|nr:hypothetical protein B0H14DRAFT_3491881 [Mycena olivaceomarginata]